MPRPAPQPAPAWLHEIQTNSMFRKQRGGARGELEEGGGERGEGVEERILPPVPDPAGVVHLQPEGGREVLC